jgi:hypothetical protein
MTQAAILAASGSPGTTTGFKNKIINGNMTIDQRNGGAAQNAIASGTFMVDRWTYYASQASKFNAQQNQGAITPPPGFINYQGFTVASAATVGAADYFFMNQIIEGFNSADLGWGTANAKTVTISAWVYSSLTGTFGGAFRNNATNYSCAFSYNIPVANTWTQVSATISGPTAGTWLTNNSGGVVVDFSLGTGSNRLGTAGVWNASEYLAPTGAVNVVATAGATFYITGVQFEVGTTATNFDFRSYGTELSLCQRYYQKTDSLGLGTTPSSTAVYMVFQFVVTMRTAPTASVAGTTWSLTDGYASDQTATSPTIGSVDTASIYSIRLQLGGFSGLTVGRVYFWRPVSTSLLGLSAEL